MGWRGRRGSRSWPGAGPFSHLPPWQRPGWVYGYGRGAGLGRGFGYGIGVAPYNPWVCQRFPWLLRWWWANPYARLYGAQYPLGYGYAYTPPYQVAPTPDAELEMLDSYFEQLKEEQERVSKRIEDLKKMLEEGAQTGTSTTAGPIPYWGLMPYGMPTPEQERAMLEQQAKALEDHIDAVKKRLEELRKGD
ncbi:MAG: DUF5320 domain-containing protein [Candidatus Bathyarchaeia archaeon]